MMKYFFCFLFIVSTASASERYEDHCESSRRRVQQIQKTITQLTAELVQMDPGPEGHSPSHVHSSDCEEVPDAYSGLIERRDRLSKDLKEAQKEMERRCPISSPE